MLQRIANMLAVAKAQLRIIAKQARDRLLRRYDETYPGFGFSQHKGYPTKLHLEALNKLGITPIHRRSYAPVRKVLEVVDG